MLSKTPVDTELNLTKFLNYLKYFQLICRNRIVILHFGSPVYRMKVDRQIGEIAA